MALDLTNLILSIVVILVFYLWYRRHDPRLPPTPATPWPVLGNLVHIDRSCPRQQFLRWREQLGDIYSVYMGPKLVVFLNGYNSVKEAFVKNSCNHRPYYFYDEATGHPRKGIVFSNGSVWKEQREVTLSIFRSLGVGKNRLAVKILEIAEKLAQALADLKGEPSDIDLLLTMSVSNVIWSFSIGRTFDYDDKSLQQGIRCLRSSTADAGGQSLVNYFDFLRYVPGDLFKVQSIKKKIRYIMDTFLKHNIREISDNESNDNIEDNYITAYIRERNRKLKTGIPTTMDDINLMKNVFDFFGAGTDTVSTTLYWCVLYLLHYPDRQEKLFQEVEREIGTTRLPNMEDKPKLISLNAYILEIQRLRSVVPLGVLTETTEEITLGGYTIPKGASLLPNLDSVLWDEDTWGPDAMSFRPERFIDEDGKIKHYEEFIPFSIGKRMCLGETLVRMELYLFFAVLVQRFRFVSVDPSALPPLQAINTAGFTAPPIPYQLRALNRQTIP